MTGGEILIQEGLQAGLRRGREEGRKEGARLVLLAFLRFRFGELPPHAFERVDKASCKDLERWILAAGSVSTLDELLSS